MKVLLHLGKTPLTRERNHTRQILLMFPHGAHFVLALLYKDRLQKSILKVKESIFVRCSLYQRPRPGDKKFYFEEFLEIVRYSQKRLNLNQ